MVCDSVIQLVSHRAADLGVGVDLDAPDPSLRVALSGDSLRQVVLNLVLNALDATPRGGRVRVAAAAVAGGAELRVEDEGPGIPAALRERVFEAFFSSKADAPGGSASPSPGASSRRRAGRSPPATARTAGAASASACRWPRAERRARRPSRAVCKAGSGSAALGKLRSPAARCARPSAACGITLRPSRRPARLRLAARRLRRLARRGSRWWWRASSGRAARARRGPRRRSDRRPSPPRDGRGAPASSSAASAAAGARRSSLPVSTRVGRPSARSAPRSMSGAGGATSSTRPMRGWRRAARSAAAAPKE